MGKNLVFVPECHSTNTLAQEMSQLPHAVDGTVIVTNHQSAGRGQRGNTWVSEPGKNLTFSVILRPAFLRIHDQFYLNMIASLAVYQMLSDRAYQDIKIKWPNDVLLAGKKVCGILIENQIQGQQVSRTIIGIGLNVNQLNFELDYATSMAKSNGQQQPLDTVLNDLLGKLESLYLQMKSGRYSAIRSEYMQHLFGRDVVREFTANDTSFYGTIRDIDENGKLIVERDGALHAFGLKEISYVR